MSHQSLGVTGIVLLDQEGKVCCSMKDVRDCEQAVEMLKARIGVRQSH